jgi:hypothetical protein
MRIIIVLLLLSQNPEWANDALHDWFDSLRSDKGLCCNFADGAAIQDIDWDTKDGHYRVRLSDRWIDVPPEAVVTERNRAKTAIVWPYFDSTGQLQIRCFIAGPGS